MESMVLGAAAAPKIAINVGCGFDICNGAWITGNRGESIINGGFSTITGFAGPGNVFKSTISDYMVLTAADMVSEDTDTQIATYDSEMNVSYDRKENLANRMLHLPKPLTWGDKITWSITDKATVHANEWAKALQDYSERKLKSKNDDIVFEAFLDPVTRKPLTGKIPTFSQIDSFSEFESTSGADTLAGDLDSSDTNTHFMKQGLFKTKFLSNLPRIATGANIYTTLVSHVGEKIDMATGPAKYNQPLKELQHLKQSVKFKGVTGKFGYLTTSIWIALSSTLLRNQTTKLAEYPLKTGDVNAEDLNIVKLQQLRSKTGQSGCYNEVIVSQNDGVLRYLTNFNFIKENNRYGIEGNNVHYSLTLYPEVSLSRTTVRSKIDEDPKLARACELTSNLLEMWIYHQRYEGMGLLCSPKELYDDIKALGYDWNILLNTRGHWKIKQYTGKPYLSILCLLRMRKGLYKPYFLEDDKTLKKEYIGY